MRRSSLLCVGVLLVGCGSSGGDDAANPGIDGGGMDASMGNADAGHVDAGDANTNATDASRDDASTTDASTNDAAQPPMDASTTDAVAPPLDAASDASGTCGACDTPPDACHAKQGTCQNGQCNYAFVTGATCDDNDPCTVADTCANGGCSGTAISCTTPPAAVCTSGTQSITYDSQGTCNGGLCVYASHMTSCNNGPCANGVCTNDPCATISCNTPPSGCYKSGGVCTNGSCSYPYDDGATCDDANACTTNDQCNSGACKGTPLACNTPPANVCADPNTLKVYSPSGTCSAATCSYASSFVTCAGGCANGTCNAMGWTSQMSNTTQPLWAVWGSSASAVWAVGEGGTAVFYNGAQWQVRPVPSQATGAFMVAIHGTASDNVVALAGSALIRFDGMKWNYVTTIPNTQCSMTTGVFATGDAKGDVYVSCWWVDSSLSNELQTLFEIDGAGNITQVTQASSNIGCVGHNGGVWAFSPTNVWMGGCPPQSWSGSALAPIGTSAPGGDFIWSPGSPSSVFTLPYNANQDGSGVAQYWDGMMWNPLNSGLNGTLTAVSGTSASRVFFSAFDFNGNGAVEFYDGTGFTSQSIPASPRLRGVYAAPSGEVFVVGDSGTILKGP
jgi:hypothetical protein